MSDAPEKIWAGPSEDDKGVFWDVGHWDADHDENCIEYTRSDLPPSAEVIRGMVKPLVWEAGDGFTASDEYLTADNGMGGGYWTMEGELGCSFDFDTFNDVFFDGDFEAQAAANEHHANTILAALGLTE